MARHLFLAGVVWALVLSLMPTAGADAWVRWKDQTTPRSMQVVEAVYDDPSEVEGYVYQFGSDFFSPGPLLDDSSVDFHTCDFPQRLRVVGGGTGAWRSTDPDVAIYVRLITKVKNVGTEDWTDFHLRAVSGCSIYGKYAVASSYWDPTSDEYGWDYEMNPMDAPYGGEYGPVYTGQTFSCETWIEVTSLTGDFEVELWPTPEPSALLVLGMGASGLAAGILRRRRSS